jgi:hypothetical protein
MGSMDDTLAPYTDVKVYPEDINTLNPFNAFSMPGEDKADDGFDEFSLVNGWDRRLAI